MESLLLFLWTGLHSRRFVRPSRHRLEGEWAILAQEGRGQPLLAPLQVGKSGRMLVNEYCIGCMPVGE